MFINEGLYSQCMGNKSRILLIDDEPEILRAHRRVLQSVGDVELVLANDGQEGLDLYRQSSGDYAVVVTDQNMPRKKGLEVLAELAGEESLALRVLAASCNDEEQQQAQVLGAYVLSKPFGNEELFKLVQDGVKLYQQRTESQHK